MHNTRLWQAQAGWLLVYYTFDAFLQAASVPQAAAILSGDERPAFRNLRIEE